MKTIVITGANSGIGYETAKHLALMGNKVIAASRKRQESSRAIEELNSICQKKKAVGRVEFYHLDLADLMSVDAFAQKLLADYPVIDTLICNAGIMNSPYGLSCDGFEQQFQTNFLSHYYLTQLLLPSVLKSDTPKVIYVGSASAEKGIIRSISELENISRVSQTEYDAMKSYRESKLAQQISVFELARRPEYGTVKFSLIHPGIVNTNLFYRNSGLGYRLLMLPFVYMGYAGGFFKTPKQGAATSIFLAENNDYQSGLYWHKTKNLEPNPISADAEYANKLVNWTNEMLKK